MQMSQVVTQLRQARASHHRECMRIDNALTALGNHNGHSAGRTLSAAARKKIGDAQRERWAMVRKAKSVGAKKTKS